MTRSRKSLLALVAGSLLVAGAVWWLVATPQGARWILARAENALPVQLKIEDVRGTLTRGLRFDTVRWTGDGVDVAAGDLFVHVELMPLLQRVVRILDIRASSLDILLVEQATKTQSDTGPFELDLPVDILLQDALIERISVVRGDLQRDLDKIELAADLRDQSLNVARLVVTSDWLTLEAAGKSRLSGRFPSEATLRWTLAMDGRAFEGSLDIDGDTDAFDIEHILANPFTVNTSGRIAFEDEQVIVDLINRWTDLRWPVAERELQSAEGALRLKGPLDNLAIGLDALARADDVPLTSIALEGVTDLQRLRQIELVLQNDFGLLSANGLVEWAPELNFAVDFELSDLDPALAHATLSGRVGAAGRTVGQYTPDDFAVSVSLQQLTGTMNEAALAGSGQFDIATNSVDVEALEIALGSNRLRVDGKVEQRMALSVLAEFEDLSALLPGAFGSLSASAEVSGTRESPQLQSTLRGSRLGWSDISLAEATADLVISGSGELDGNLSFAEFSTATRTVDSGTVGIEGTLKNHRLETQINGFDGSLSLAAVGGLDDAVWTGELASIALDNPLTGAWQGEAPAAVTLSADASRVSELCLARNDASGRACVAGALSGTGDASANLLIEGLPVAILRVPLPDGVTADGKLFARADVNTVGGRLSGTSSIEIRDARVETSIDGENYATGFSVIATTADLDDNRLAARLNVRTSDDAAVVEAMLNVADISLSDSAMSGEGTLRVDDAAILAALIPDLTQPQGRIAGNVDLGGSISVPVVTGEVRLSEGAFSVRRAGIAVEDVEVSFAQLTPGSLQLRGSARSGDGQLTLRGDTYVGTETGLRTELNISGKDFEILRLPDWQASASPEVSIVVDERQTIVSGEIAVPSADINVKDIPESATSPSTDAVVHRADVTRADEMQRTLDVDLRASLGDDVRLKAFGLNTGLGGSVQMRGGSGQAWRGFGRVELTDGIYKSYGQELDIERGLLIFNGPLDNPQLDIRAIRRIDSITAGIHLTGTPQTLRSSVYSEPSMRDAEALSYLLTGRPLSGDTSSSDGDMLGNAAFALGLSGAGLVASRVRSQLGLDSLSVEGGADDGRIIAGKRLNSRLLVEYGYGLVDRLGTLLLRYQLNERLVIESRTGASSNFDIYYRVRKQ